MTVRRAIVVGAVALAPGAALACPSCFGTVEQKVLDTYYLSTAMLSLLPFVLVGVGILVARFFARESRSRNALRAHGPRPTPAS